jgi:DNA-binding NarL/FixJ family response regulator
MTTRLLLADDQHIVREGLRALITMDPEFEVVGEADNGADAVRLARQLRPDVVLMDLLMPEFNGVAATAAIRDEVPETQVLVLTGLNGDRSIAEAVQAGAIGYLHKDIAADELRRAIKAAADGSVQLSRQAASWLMRQLHTPERPEKLTPREADVLRLLARGLANKEIARELGIGETTVKSHVRHILSKLGVGSRTQAALAAFCNGFLPEPPHEGGATGLAGLATTTQLDLGAHRW